MLKTIVIDDVTNEMIEDGVFIRINAARKKMADDGLFVSVDGSEDVELHVSPATFEAMKNPAKETMRAEWESLLSDKDSMISALRSELESLRQAYEAVKEDLNTKIASASKVLPDLNKEVIALSESSEEMERDDVVPYSPDGEFGFKPISECNFVAGEGLKDIPEEMILPPSVSYTKRKSEFKNEKTLPYVEMLTMLAEGKKPKEVAEALNIAPSSVSNGSWRWKKGLVSVPDLPKEVEQKLRGSFTA